MIRYIKGQIIDKDDKFIVIETGGIGYKVFVTTEISGIQTTDEQFSLWIYHVVREDASDLFGFKEKEDLAFFELLIGISGIGPKTALGILNVANTSTLKKAIFTEDPSYLVKVSGIGKKVADKIVLELKGKVSKDEGVQYESKEDTDALEALKSLGYNQKDAREALKEISKEISTGEKIKQALKILGK